MKYEKIIKRKDGPRFQICVDSYMDCGEIKYRTYVYICEKGKRKWLSLPDTMSNWEFRNLSMKDRDAHRWENMLRFVSQSDIMQAQIEYWETLRPKYPMF
jgi:hypothetical protein